MEKGITQTAKHTLMLDGRSRAKLTGVTAVSCFNDREAVSYTHLDVYKRKRLYITNQDLKRHISNIATTKNEITQQGLGQARPNKKLSQGGKNFQELKICGHGTILALTKTRTF